MNAPRPLSESLGALFRHLGAPPPSAVATIHDRWDEIVGPVVASHCRPAEFSDGVLNIVCDDATWASQLSWMETQIRSRCDHVLGRSVIERVRIRVAR